MADMLAGPFEKTFMDKHSIFMNLKTDDQFNLLSNAVLEPIADMQKCDELLVQPIPGATINCHGNRRETFSSSHYYGN